MASRRQMMWIDSLQSDIQNVIGAAAPGTIVDFTLLSGAETADAGKSTITRIVGELWMRASVGAPVVTMAIHVLGAQDTAETDWTAFAFEQRPNILWTGMYFGIAGDGSIQPTKIPIDIRAKRKLTTGSAIVLSVQNHAIINNDCAMTLYTRSLLMLS